MKESIKLGIFLLANLSQKRIDLSKLQELFKRKFSKIRKAWPNLPPFIILPAHFLEAGAATKSYAQNFCSSLTSGGGETGVGGLTHGSDPPEVKTAQNIKYSKFDRDIISCKQMNFSVIVVIKILTQSRMFLLE